MKALELLINQEKLLLTEAIDNKKTQALATTLNDLMAEMCNQIKSFKEFSASQLDGDYNNKIVVAKSLANFFANNKHLKVENAVATLANEEKTKLSEYYAVKTKLLDTISTIIKESAKSAVVSNYDIFEGEFVKCEPGHEIIILSSRNVGVLETFQSELDKELIVNGNFDSVEAQEVEYSLDTLNRNIKLCQRKNNEIFGSKTGKLNKLSILIDKLQEVGKIVVAFYTYKTSLELIGCNPKGIKDFENELSKAYIPLKKTLQKELRIELEDICNVTLNEDEFEEIGTEDNLSKELKSPFSGSNFTSPETTFSAQADLTNEPVADNQFDINRTSESPFDNVNSVSEDPFEVASATTPNPFESTATNPFESSATNPFENVNNEPLENVDTTPLNDASELKTPRPTVDNPFDNALNNSPLDNQTDSTKSTNPFGDFN